MIALPILSVLAIPQGGEGRRKRQLSRSDGITYSAEGACLCVLKAKGSATAATVCISQGGVADSAEPGSLPALLLPHSSALRSLPFIGHSGRGLKVGLVTMVSVGPGFLGHQGLLCSPLTLPT